MTMFIAAHGRLGADPRPITTKTGKPMCFGSIAVELPGRDDEAFTQWIGLVAFARLADDLARHQKGDMVGVSGRVQSSRYKAADGIEKQQLQIVVDSLISARNVRSSAKRPKSPAHGDEPATTTAAAEPEFNDDLPAF